MKVMLLNGSPRADGNTNLALTEIAKTLNENGIETEIFQIGTDPVPGCTACTACYKLGHCVKNDIVTEFAKKMEECDGLVIGSPVYFASPNGSLIAFLDRLFYSASEAMTHKPAAAVACARRGGTTAALDVLNKYITYNEMPLVSSTYWNNIHGRAKGEAAQDAEGMQTMRNIGTNMAWLLKCIEAGKAAGVAVPTAESGSITNFIR